MRCEELMTREVECLEPSDTVVEAARRMSELDIGFIPVCRSDGTPLGTVTDRDVVVRVVATQKAFSTPLEEVMSADVVTCRPDDDITRAEQLMRANQISRILCVDDDGKVAGVISLADIAQYELETEAGKLLADVKQSEAHVH
jgi:CBS domain-containing protein